MKQIFTVTGAHPTSSQTACNKASEKANEFVTYLSRYAQHDQPVTILDLVARLLSCPQGFVQSIDILINTESIINTADLPFFEGEDDFPEEEDYGEIDDPDHCDDNDAVDDNYLDCIDDCF